MLHLLQSQRLEALADALLTHQAPQAAPALEPELILTPTHGVTDWLRLRLARQLGICANVQFQLPTAYWLPLAQRLDCGVAQTPEQLTWQLYRVISVQAAALDLPLTWQQGTPRQRWLLAAQLARCYADYALYRPEWLPQWEQAPPHWQARLWQALIQQFPATRLPGQVLTRLLTLLQTSSQTLPASQRVALPSRLILFGFSSLAPLELALFTALAQSGEIWLYSWMPCQEYWGDVRSASQLAKQVNRPNFSAQHYTEGHRLLAAWGSQAREWLELLLEQGHEPESAYEMPDSSTLLGSLQADILTLRREEPAPRQPWAVATDLSLQIQGAHSPIRELEVLHDQLLHLLRREPDLGPGDMAILVPELERYAPYIDAVFGHAPAHRRIPYSLADRSLQVQQPLSQTLLRILADLPSRWPLSGLLDYLELPAVARRFVLAPEALPRIRHWLEATHARWGSDAAHRAALGLPATDEHSFRAAARRLLLGYALPETASLYAGIIPDPRIEGTDALLLGHLLHYLETLFQLNETGIAPRTLTAWSQWLLALSERLFLPDTDAEAENYAALRTAFLNLAEAESACPLPVEREVVVQTLQTALDTATVVPFLQGRVNFCALTPARALPFAVIGLLGLNQGDFPKITHPSELDLLLTAKPRLGDRMRLRDDRALMLQILHATQRHLYLSYVSRDVRDDSPRPPSVLLSELQEALAEHYDPPLAVQQHPLQAFAPHYFHPETSELQRSYAQEWVQASLHTCQPTPPARAAFCPTPLEVAPKILLDFAELVQFWEHPIRYWVRRCLQVQLLTLEEAVSDSEPFGVDPLAESRLFQALWQLEPRPQHREDWQQQLARLRAQSQLPHGTPGAAYWQNLAGEFCHLQQQMRLTFGVELPPETFSLAIADVTLQGQLTQCYTYGLGHYAWARPKAKHRLRLWLEHLIWQQIAKDKPRTSRWLGKSGGAFDFKPLAPEQAQAILADLIAGYQLGQTQPLYFFPETAYAYQATLHAKGAKNAESEAHHAWIGSTQQKNQQKPGERDDLYVRLVLGAEAHYAAHRASWLPWAAQIYLPLLECQAGDIDASEA